MNPDVLEKYRNKKNLSCTELCVLMGKSDSWYSRIRTGEVGLKPKYINKMAGIFGIKPEKLAREYFSGVQLEDTAS
jgi:transcriptional regulator with XRE-family HTH domain